MRIHIAYADFPQEMNTSIWRCFIPYHELKKKHNVTISHFTEIDSVSEIDTLLVERNLFNDNLIDNIRRLKSEGTKIVATFDDAYHLMPSYIVSKASWGKENLVKFYSGLGLCDCAILPSKLLCQDYSSYCETMFVPNFFDEELYEGIKHTSDKGVRVFWSGNDTHKHSILESGVLDSLVYLCGKYKNLSVVTAGGTDTIKLFGRVLSKRHFSVDLSMGAKLSGLVTPHIANLVSWMPLDHWVKIVADFADIGIAPLVGEYDRRRSCVKCYDFGMLKLPFVGSNLEPYQDIGCELADGKQGWIDKLEPLVKDGFARELAGERLYEHVSRMSIQKNLYVYEEVLGC
jgi:hypothetical protein